MSRVDEAVDGRNLRRIENRDAVLDALIALYEEGIYQPSTALIAERAGISSRSLFRYFDDTDDLSRAAIDRQLEAARPLTSLQASPSAPLAQRITSFVEGRVRLFEEIAPTARAARVAAARHRLVARQLTESRSYLRRQVELLFAPELTRTPEVLPALDALCSFETYDLLCSEQRLGRKQIVDALTVALDALLHLSGGIP